MGIEDIELDVGGTKFKGVYIAILFSFATTIGGGIWAASEFVSRIDNIESNLEQTAESIPNIEPIELELASIRTKIEDNDLSHLQGKLAELDTLLSSIKERQSEVLQGLDAASSPLG